MYGNPSNNSNSKNKNGKYQQIYVGLRQKDTIKVQPRALWNMLLPLWLLMGRQCKFSCFFLFRCLIIRRIAIFSMRLFQQRNKPVYLTKKHQQIDSIFCKSHRQKGWYRARGYKLFSCSTQLSIELSCS